MRKVTKFSFFSVLISAIVSASLMIPAFAAPSNLRIYSQNNKLMAEWNADPDATSYQLEIYKGETKIAKKKVNGTVVDITLAAAKKGAGDYSFVVNDVKSNAYSVSEDEYNTFAATMGYGPKQSSTETKPEAKPETTSESKPAEEKADKSAENYTESTELAKNGSLATVHVTGKTSGWVNSNGKWTYELKDGKQLKSSWLEDNGLWYAFDKNGDLCLGWHDITGTDGHTNPYYFAEKEVNGKKLGQLYIDETTPDGKHVNEIGLYYEDPDSNKPAEKTKEEKKEDKKEEKKETAAETKPAKTTQETEQKTEIEPEKTDEPLKKGDIITVNSNITYEGKRFKNISGSYTVYQIKGDRVVISNKDGIVAAVNIANVNKVG